MTKKTALFFLSILSILGLLGASTPQSPGVSAQTSADSTSFLLSWSDNSSNVYWDGPLTSPIVSVVSGPNGNITVVAPGPEDYVNVIVQLKGDPVATYEKQQLEVGRLTAAEATASRATHAQRLDDDRRSVKAEAQRRNMGLTVKREFDYLVNGMAATVKQKDIEQLRQMPQVQAVYPDFKVHADLSQSVPLIGVGTTEWQQLTDSQGNPVKGQGIKIAVVDTGVDYTHPDLSGRFGAYKGYDLFNNDANPMDDNGHGTHVAGISAANGVLKGVAPEATLLAYKVLGADGSGDWSDVIAGINRAVQDGANVINMSLGGPGSPGDIVEQAVNTAVSANVTVVVAAGNSGLSLQTIDSPGLAAQAITVGASDKSDNIASFSARGPVPGTWLAKPDLLAPGSAIYSTALKGTGWHKDPSGYTYLGGTSMATPHIAGAAALIKQLHPTWTPAQIKANLMNTALDLDKTAYAQGAGRAQVNKAATAKAIITPGSLSLGQDPTGQQTWQKAEFLTVRNVSSTTQTYNLSIAPGLPSGITATVDPSATVAAGQSTTVVFSLTVDNTVLSKVAQAPYYYEGRIVAQSASETLEVPFSFVTSVLTLTFDTHEGQAPWMVLIHDRSTDFRLFQYGSDFNTRREGNVSVTTLSAIVSNGTYDVIVTYKDGITHVVRESIQVSGTTSVTINKASAQYTATISPVDNVGQPLTVASGAQKIVHKGSGIWQMFSGQFATQRTFSTLSSQYVWEWAGTTGTKSAGPVYDINGHADGISGNVSFQNSPADYKHLTWKYNPPPTVSQLLILHWLSDGPAANWSYAAADAAQTPLTAPFIREQYYMPPPYAEFGFGYFYERVYPAISSPYSLGSPNYAESNLLFATPYMRVKDSATVEGYLPGQTTPVFSTNSSVMPVGQAPPYWSGRFANTSSKIVLAPSAGSRNWLFLNQRQDLRRHVNLPYLLWNGSTWLDGTLAGAGTLDSTAPVEIAAASGNYTMRVPYSQYYVNGQQGTATVTATFGTGGADKNPPYIVSLNLVSASGDGDSAPGQDGVEYKSQLASPPGGQGSLKVVATDKSGNSLTYQVEPAYTTAGQVKLRVADDQELDTVAMYYKTTGDWVQLSWSSEIPRTFGAGWNLFSLPVQPDPSNWQAQLGDVISPLYIYNYDPAIGGYRMWSSTDNTFAPESGKGYWVRTTASTEVKAKGFTPSTSLIASTEYFTIPLSGGWNMIGDPFNAGVLWSDIKVKPAGSETLLSVSQAVSQGLFQQTLFSYDTAMGGYIMTEALSPGAGLVPWYGYWMRANQAVDLLVPRPA